eukprot:TRINITY_DN14085_c0_g1_i1.p1 TRINITY_DN14085_c0_g1~~TRINITY_DN14085_c0_g1_i1.p1  ORF type:complete len:235 (+),score=31.40 TRINITY_DN14085_c0_g1_i1:93-707(+)
MLVQKKKKKKSVQMCGDLVLCGRCYTRHWKRVNGYPTSTEGREAHKRLRERTMGEEARTARRGRVRRGQATRRERAISDARGRQEAQETEAQREETDKSLECGGAGSSDGTEDVGRKEHEAESVTEYPPLIQRDPQSPHNIPGAGVVLSFEELCRMVASLPCDGCEGRDGYFLPIELEPDRYVRFQCQYCAAVREQRVGIFNRS